MNKQGPDEGRYPIQDTLVALGAKITGRNARGFRAECLFHADTIPSLWIYTDTNSYYCFGCGAWGGPVAAVEAANVIAGRFSRKAALEWLGAHVDARRVAPRLDKYVATNIQGRGQPSDMSFALDRLLQVGAYDHAQTGRIGVPHHTAPAYLRTRGFTDTIMDAVYDLDLPLVLGAFPQRTFRLRVDSGAYKALHTLGVTNARGWLQKRFCPSVYFGIRDLRGVVVGMQARSLREPPTPKYLFTKSYTAWTRARSLYLLAESLTTWGAARRLTLVEGPIDALAVLAANEPVAAVMGDQLTAGQMDLLHAAGVHKVRLWFDADRAGRQATAGVTEGMRKRGYDVVAVPPTPGFKDAAEGLEKYGAGAVVAALDAAQ